MIRFSVFSSHFCSVSLIASVFGLGTVPKGQAPIFYPIKKRADTPQDVGPFLRL